MNSENPAFPQTEFQNITRGKFHEGVSIRDYAALKILCALITNEGASSSDNSEAREADVKRAYLYADELIKQSEQ